MELRTIELQRGSEYKPDSLACVHERADQQNLHIQLRRSELCSGVAFRAGDDDQEPLLSV